MNAALTNAPLLQLYLLIPACWREGDFFSLAAAFPVGGPRKERAVLLQSVVHAPALCEASADALITRSLATLRSPAALQWWPVIAAAAPDTRKNG